MEMFAYMTYFEGFPVTSALAIDRRDTFAIITQYFAIRTEATFITLPSTWCL